MTTTVGSDNQKAYKYKKLDDIINYSKIKFFNENPINEIFDINFLDVNIELYFGYVYEEGGAVWQCIKSAENNNSEKISNYIEGKYERDHCDYDIEDEFDETNEVYEGRSRSIWLYKITSQKFIQMFQRKINEWQDSISLKDNSFYLSDFLEWLEFEIIALDSLTYLYEHLNGDINDIEVILDEVNIDDNDNCIKWYSYSEIEFEYFQIGYRIKQFKTID